MTNIIYTFSSYKTYYRVFFNGLLNTNMYFQFESDEQNNGEFEMHNFDLSLVFQKYIWQSSTQSKNILFLTLSYTVYWTNTIAYKSIS